MSSFTKKIIISVGLLLILTSPVLAFEINYPDIPGLGAIKEGQTLGYYTKYFLNLAFYIAAGVCLIMIVVAGFLYVVNLQNPTALVNAKTIVKRGIFGLAIIACSYLFLYIINPSLLIFNPTMTFMKGMGGLTYSPETPEVVFARIQTGGVIKATISAMEAPEQPDINITKETKETAPQMKAALVPFYEAKTVAENLVSKTRTLNRYLECCKCGASKWHYPDPEKEMPQVFLPGQDCRCLSGDNFESAGSSCVEKTMECYSKFNKTRNGNDNNDSTDWMKKLDDTALQEALKERDTTCRNSASCWQCSAFCESCQCDSKCFAERLGSRVIAVVDPQKPDFVYTYTNQSIIPQEHLDWFFEQEKTKIAEMVGYLKTIKTKLDAERLKPLENSLEVLKHFMLSYMGQIPITQADMNFLKGNLEQGGALFNYWKNYFLAKSKQSNIKLAQAATEQGVAPSSLNVRVEDIPGIFAGNITPSPVSWLNTIVIREDKDNILGLKSVAELNTDLIQRLVSQMSLYGIIALDNVAEFQAAIEECFQAAFGNVSMKTLLANSDFKKVFEQMAQAAMIKGIGGTLVVNFSDQSQALAKIGAQAVQEQTEKDFQAASALPCREKCKDSDILKVYRITETQCLWRCDPETCWNASENQEACKDRNSDKCARACRGIGPNFVSKKISQFLTGDIETQLPDELKLLLNKSVEDTLFSTSTQKNYLDASILDLLQRGFGEVASTSVQNMLNNDIQKTLSSKLSSFAPDWLAKPAGAIDKFLFKSVTETINTYKTQAATTTANWVKGFITPWVDKILPFSRSVAEANAKLKSGGVIDVENFLNQYYKGEKKITSKQTFIDDCVSSLSWVTNEESSEFKACIAALSNDECVRQEKQRFCSGAIWETHKNEVSSEQMRELLKSMGNWQAWADMLKNWVSDLFDITFARLAALPGQLVVATAQTATYAFTNYTIALLEDKVFTPYFYVYWEELKDIRNSLQKALNMTVKDALPPLVQNALQRNLVENFNAILNTVCQAGKEAARKGDLNIDLKEIKLIGGSTLSINNVMSTETAMQACSISENLNEDLKKKLSLTTQEALNMSVVKFFDEKVCTKYFTSGDKCLENLLNMSPNELFFKWLGVDINSIITATPKNLICGEVKYYKDISGKRTVTLQTICKAGQKIEDGRTVFDVIQAQKALQSVLHPDELSDLADKMSQCRDYVKPLCLDTLMSRFGYLFTPINVLTSQQCIKVKRECGGQVNSYDCEACSSNNKSYCKACQAAFEQTLAFTMIYSLVLEADQDQAKELNTYQWLLLLSPQLPQWQAEIDKVAEKRGLTAQWLLKKKEVIDGTLTMANMPYTAKDFLQTFFGYFMSGTKMEYILTHFPDGITKPAKAGEAALIKDAGQGLTTNMLNETPLSLLTLTCSKITSDRNKIENNQAPFNGLTDEEKTDVLKNYTQASQICQNLNEKVAKLLGLDVRLLEFTDGYKNMFLMLNNPSFIQDNEKPPQLNELLDFVNNETVASGLLKEGSNIGNIGQGMWLSNNCKDLSAGNCQTADFLIQSSKVMQEVGLLLNSTLKGYAASKDPSLANKKFVYYLAEKAVYDKCLEVNQCEDKDKAGKEKCEYDCRIKSRIDAKNFLNKGLAEVLKAGDLLSVWQLLVRDYLVKTPDNILYSYGQSSLMEYLLQAMEWSSGNDSKLTVEEKRKMYFTIKKIMASSLLDAFILNPSTQFLGQPLIDTVGRLLGFDFMLDKISQSKDEFYNSVDTAIKSSEAQLHDVTDYAVKIPETAALKIADAFDSNALATFTKNIFMDVTGTGCKEMADEKKFSVSTDKYKSELPDSGNSNISQAFLDEFYAAQKVVLHTDLIEKIGENQWKIDDRDNDDTWQIVINGGKLNIQLACLAPKVEKGTECCNAGEPMTCTPAKNNSCERCRILLNTQDASACRKEDPGSEIYREDKQKNDKGEVISDAITKKCCHTLSMVNGKCCQNLMDCILEKTNSFLMTNLNRAMSGEGLPNSIWELKNR